MTRTAPVATSADQQEAWRDWGLLYAGFAIAAAVGLLLPAPALGWRVLALVVGFHVACVLIARRGGHALLMRSWFVLAPLSVLMVLPDWFLSEVLGSLRFGDIGGPFIGDVPLAMAGMWTIALLPVAGVALAAHARDGTPAAIGAALAAGFVMFVVAEMAAPLLGLWEPISVATIAGVATYVIVPELVLSVAAALLVCFADALPRAAVAALTALLPFTYLGLLASSYQFLA